MQVNVLEYFIKSCQTYHERVAVVDARGSWTFGELDRHSRALARAIERRTTLINTPIAIYLSKSREAVAAILAALFSGNCYAPLDVKAPITRIKSIIDHLTPSVIVSTRELSRVLIASGWDPSKIIMIEDMEAESEDRQNIWHRCIDTDPAYIIHTSGSTGRPKGVVISHRGVIDYIDWAIETFSVDKNCVIGNQAPLVFDNSTLDLYLCFARGATLYLIPEELFSFPVRLMEYISGNSINFIFWVPSVLVNVANAGVLDKTPNLKLEKILFAGEVMPAMQLNVWRRRLPLAVFANLYGPTEITVDCTYYVVSRNLRDDEPVPIGRACRNTGILILNEADLPCAQLEKGELCVRGSSVALGYWNDPEKTALSFVQNPLHKRYPEVIYRTGDIVYANKEGEIIYVGRKDFQVKHMGYRIELGEIEHFALQVAGIRAACVLYERNRKQIALLYEADHELDAGFIRTEMGKHLPKYMWPTIIKHMIGLPHTPNGKVDRQRLAELCGSEHE